MKVLISIIALSMLMHAVYMVPIETHAGETSLHFDFKTANGQQRVEDIKYDNTPMTTVNVNGTDEVTMSPVEFRGGYSFISADGYEYTVKYKANKNGFQPYVTAHKLSTATA